MHLKEAVPGGWAEKTMSKTTHLVITPDEAVILDSCFKGDTYEFEEHKGLLARLGSCIVTGKSRAIEFDEPTLWYIRSRLELDLSIGDTGAVDVLKHVYAALIEIIGNRYFNSFLEVEEYGNENSPSSDKTSTIEDNSENRTASRPTEKVEPRQALPCPEGGYCS